MPVSTSTRPDGVSISRQFSAWSSRLSASSSSVTRRFQSRRGTGPNNAPASDRKVPAWTSATRVPPPRSASQSTASLMATRLAFPVEVPVIRRRRRLPLPLVARAELGRAVRSLDSRRHLEERDLADAHAVVEGDREVRDVRQFECQVPLPTGIDVACGGMDKKPQPTQRTWPFQTCDKVIREFYPFERLTQDELARVEDERLIVSDREQLGQIGLFDPHVDVRVAVVPEHPKRAIQVEVDRRGLQI